VTSRYAETYTTIIAKCSTALQRHYSKFRANLALIPVLTDPDVVRVASGWLRVAWTVLGGIRMALDGFGRILVGPLGFDVQL